MKPNNRIFNKAIALAAVWIFSFSNVSFALRPVAMGDRAAAPSRDEVVKAKMAALSPASLEDLRRNEQDPPSDVCYVGIMCVDLIHNATGILPGMESSPLTLAGNIEGSIDPDGSKQAAYVAELNPDDRKAATDLTAAISGGPATSSARVCKQLAGRGVNASLITSVGRNGTGFIQTHQAIGVDMTHVNISTTRDTAKTLVFELPGDRRFLHNIGASAELTIRMLKPEYFRGKKVVEFGGVELSGLMPDLDEALAMAKREGCITVLDTVVDVPHQWKAFSRKYGRDYLKAILGRIDVFTPSIGEAAQIYADYMFPDDSDAAAALKEKIEKSKGRVVEELAAFFVAQGAKAVFLKNGKDGVYACIAPDSVFKEINQPTAFHIPILRGFKEVSNTGTGDAFTGAAAYALAKGWPARRTAMFANVVGGMCVEHKGGTIEDESLVDALYNMQMLEAQMAQDARETYPMLIQQDLQESMMIEEDVAQRLMTAINNGSGIQQLFRLYLTRKIKLGELRTLLEGEIVHPGIEEALQMSDRSGAVLLNGLLVTASKRLDYRMCYSVYTGTQRQLIDNLHFDPLVCDLLAARIAGALNNEQVKDELVARLMGLNSELKRPDAEKEANRMITAIQPACEPGAPAPQAPLQQKLLELQEAERTLLSLQDEIGGAAAADMGWQQRKPLIETNYTNWTSQLQGVLYTHNSFGVTVMPNLVGDDDLRDEVMASNKAALNYLGQLQGLITTTLRIVRAGIAPLQKALDVPAAAPAMVPQLAVSLGAV